jgi:subtilisin-like proprotein convertase family protein
MKKTYNKTLNFLFLIVFSVVSSISFSQTNEQVKQITAEYDLKKGEELLLKVKKREEIQKKEVENFSIKNSLPIFKKNSKGSFDQLMKIEAGIPIYYSIENAAAATSTRVNFLRTGGGLGLNLTGTGMVPRIWDGGPINANHQEYVGRTTFGDGQTVTNTNSFHAIHVTGTVIAAGVQTNARGMANTATARTFDWDNDESEAITEAMNGMLLSNHSYGVPVASVSGTPWYIGAYSQEAYNWDVISYTFPYYLPVMSAGNDGTATNPNPTTTGYDKLNGNKNAKNILTVANANDATVNATTGAITAGGLINSTSSQGPSDDRRIKPDITGNGTGLTSTGSGTGTGGGNTAYSSLTGTSMAAPNVTGTLTLIQQHYNNVNGKFMRAATLKGLATHTATDMGRPGPDAQYGWGYLNAKSCAETITNNGLTSWISEETLSQGQTFTMQVVATGGTTPLLGSITWTDVPDAGKINSGTLNESTPDLTNDLDIRITQGASTFYPWALQASATANAIRTGDNIVDNVERINIDSPTAGAVYTITVTHKGTLADGPQRFALVVTGITSQFTFKSTADTKTVCSNLGSEAFNFTLTKTGGPNVNFTAQNVPAGANVVITPNSMSASGNLTVNVNNLAAVAAGTYEIEIVGTNGTETEIKKITLTVFHPDFTAYPQTTNTPLDGATGVSTSPTFTWNANQNAESYNLQIATDPAFTTIVSNTTETLTSRTIGGLSSETVYYWRVIPSNRCASGNSSAIKSLQTGILDCGYSYTQGTNITINNTIDNSGALALGAGWSISTLNVPDNFVIGDVNLDLLLQHTYIQDMTIYLEAPDFTFTVLAQEVCGDNDNINAKFIDSGIAPNCTAAVPALTGNVLPADPFTTFQNLSSGGTWTLYVNDPYNGDNGTIDSWSLNICGLAPITNVPSLAKNTITTLASSTYNISNTDFEATTASQSAADQVYTLVSPPSIGDLRLNTTNLTVGSTFTQNDINSGLLNYVNSESTTTTTSFKVDIKNTDNGWLPNEVISINIVECGDISTTWNGSSWSNGAPLRNVAVTFTGNYSSTADLEACSVTVNNGANVVFNAGHTLIVNGNVTVNTGGSLTINNNAALRQIDNAAVNSGNIIVRRNSQPMIRQDYTAWSSPVAGQQLLAFSPNTVATRFYQYLYTGTTTPTAYQSVTPTTNFLAGKGYMIRVDNTWSSTVASSYNGQFTGVPTNGIVNQSIGTGYNLLGNPYASPIDADTFLADNTSIGTLYFWTNTTAASAGVYPQNNYAAYTTLGGTAAFGSGVIPNGTIQTGQGFYVQASAADAIDFNNAQRVNASTSTQFFRTSNQVNATVSAEKHRIWFNLNDTNTSYNQMLLGYMQGATNGFDNMIDGKVLDDTKPTLFNIVNTDKYVIQGRSLPFTDVDVVPLGLKVVTPGTYSISIENVDGLFTSQDVFIKDKYNNSIHNVKQTPYSFSTQDGTFTDDLKWFIKTP